MQRHTFRMLSIYLLIAMLLAACGGQEEVAPQQLAPTEAPAVEESTEKEAETASENPFCPATAACTGALSAKITGPAG